MKIKGVLSDPSKMFAIVLPVLLLIAAPSIRRRIASEKAAVTQATAGDLEARNLNAFALILGEVRATAADLMFIKTERYLHGGIAYKPHLNINKMATTGVVEANTQGHDHHDREPGCCPGGTPTLIRTASQDFRGFIGALERETKPFQDPKLPHHHGRKEELLPWYRVMTLADPHNVRGYMVGTMLLSFAKKTDEALSFIEEGIEKNRGNPQAFRLYGSLAQLHWKSRRLEKALAAAQKGYLLGKIVRPKGGKAGAVRKGLRWTDDIENDFLFLARVFPLLLDKKGETGEALRVAEEVASLAPDDVATKDMIERFRRELSKRQAAAS